MVSYTCSKCLKVFPKKSQYTYHINRKNPCKTPKNTSIGVSPLESAKKFTQDNVIQQQVIQSDALTCPSCGKHFSRLDNRNRHVNKRCKVRKQYVQSMELLMQQMIDIKKENDALKEEVKKLKETHHDSPTYNIVNTQIINNYNNTKLVAFGNEDKSLLTDTVYGKIFNRGRYSVVEFIKFLHFNIKHPENHNIFISNINSEHVLIFDGVRWMLSQRDKTIKDVYQDSVSTLDDVYFRKIAKSPESAVSRFEEFLKKSEKSEVLNDIKEELKLLFYNYRHFAESAKKRIEADDSSTSLIQDVK